MSKSTVAVLTPTYNRAWGVERLYKSLVSQTCKDFCWYIIDDGSSDDTENVVSSFTADFPIRYIKKQNGGKHTALNVGIQEVFSELTFIVDSDDWLLPNSVESIVEVHNRYREEDGLCGYAFLRAYPNGKVNGNLFAVNYSIASYIETRINGGDMMSDKAEVYFTTCLKECRFPEFPGEKFIGEDVVWLRLARKYKMVHVNTPIYIGDYLRDGLTNSRRRHNIASPLGCVARAREFLYNDINLTVRVKAGLQFLIYGKFAGMSMFRSSFSSRNAFLLIPLILPAYLLFLIWRVEYK